MENRAYALSAGTFVVVFTALMIAAVLWLGGGTPHGVPYDLITRRSVAGLAARAPVRLHGVEVGQVESIGFDPEDRRQVRVRVRIVPDALLMRGSWAHLSSLGISGNPYIELGYPEDASLVLHTSEDEPARVPLTPTGLAQLSDTGDEVLRKLGGTLARINDILTPETAAEISQLVRHSNAAAAKIRDLGTDLEPAARRARYLVADSDQTVQDADALLASVRERVGVLDTLRDTGQAVRDLTRRLSNETVPQINELAQHLQRNSDTLEQLLSEVRDRPQSVIFGVPPGTPGPGEPGFQAPHP
jgi:phospholipid/cholesterol/gamma-HCH transport system substrate-binding protein